MLLRVSLKEQKFENVIQTWNSPHSLFSAGYLSANLTLTHQTDLFLSATFTSVTWLTMSCVNHLSKEVSVNSIP